MKRPSSSPRGPVMMAEGDRRVTATGRELLQDREIDEIERSWPDGLTSRQIVDVFETRGIRFSEATLRKYVQLGLLPRSVRVGRKGKHRGSCGLRSEEHTSELQSQSNLVCRLLLEKKKKRRQPSSILQPKDSPIRHLIACHFTHFIILFLLRLVSQLRRVVCFPPRPPYSCPVHNSS